MKLLLIMYSGGRPALVPELLEHQGVHGYTEWRGAHGAGSTGKREGTRAWPGETLVYFTMVDAQHVGALIATIREEAEHAAVGERLHVAEMPVERFF